jgi:hypothetical protein
MHVCKVVIQRAAVQSDPRRFRLQTEDGVEVALLVYRSHLAPFDSFDGSGAFAFVVVVVVVVVVVLCGSGLFAALLREGECRCREE